jgi:hypothetical protein
MTYTLTQSELSTLKRRLTRRINLVRRCEQALRGFERDSRLRQELASAALKLQAEVRHAESIFASKGWPDVWSDWSRAYDDAICVTQRLGYAS